MQNDIGQVKTSLREQQYIATDEIATVMYLADRLGKPVLAEGPAGVGKTELAKAWSKVSSRPQACSTRPARASDPSCTRGSTA